ncbi:DUF6452 family protein [Flavobacterium sp. GT3R68]|uniref:DUF6452 family protein n=1 Tax=Flavobacterium sp. GT3R68 TaxID=2594437 RepID=UPI000F8870AA|nr:DUF6452 family protein [Flavobacterium sp. GT3R68]RTY95211.1 hypothetical protein EKL32_07215 [Flavobacterium sp. GSN2]TRW91047.1 hypothetical protein FNW07_09455 [Flavobacterium sp. GT3R68]
MKKIFLIVLVVAVSFSGCEKDDICDAATSTTPRLIIEFYDALNPTVLKNVTNLKVKDVDITPFLLFNGVSKIQVPLKTTEDVTNFSFTINSNSVDPLIVNEDGLQFNYARQNIFISRACGFKTIFTLDPTTPYTKTPGTNGFWIQNITVETSNIENENDTHIKIYF